MMNLHPTPDFCGRRECVPGVVVVALWEVRFLGKLLRQNMPQLLRESSSTAAAATAKSQLACRTTSALMMATSAALQKRIKTHFKEPDPGGSFDIFANYSKLDRHFCNNDSSIYLRMLR
jgi:hypothetical protein